MSTRSLIGAETDSGIRLVYVHSDGYPDEYWGKVETLRRLVAEHGVSRVVATLLQTTSGWSSFDGNPGEELQAGHTDGRFELVPGFGVRYTLTELETWGEKYTQGNAEYDTPATALNADAAYFYVIAADGKTLRWAENYSGDSWDALDWTEVDLCTH